MAASPEAQMTNYLRFARAQREASEREVVATFQDFKADRLSEDTFTKAEVAKMLDDLASQIRSTFSTELQQSASSVVIMLRQLFEQAEKQYVTLVINTAQLEDKYLLEEVKQFEEGKFGRGLGGKDANVKLSTLKTEIAPDVAEDMKNMRERMLKMQQQATAVLKEKSDIRGELEHLKHELDQLRVVDHQKDAQLKKSEEALAALQSKQVELQSTIDKLQSMQSASGAGPSVSNDYLMNLRKELAETKDALDQAVKEQQHRINESKQFQQLKKMIAQKNELLRNLRHELKQFRPDLDIPEID
eukprot:tig00020918_g15886.t1